MTVPILQIFLSFMYELATKKSGFFPLPEFPTAKSFGRGFSLWSAGSLFAVHILLLFCHLGSRALTGSAVTAHRLPEHVGSGATVADLAASQHVGS